MYNRILIAEDDPALRNLFARTLRMAGYDPILADDGQSALAYLEALQPAMLILDVGLPGMNGLDVLRIARQRHPQLHIIMVTGNHLAQEDAAAADLFLIKPVHIQELIDMVDRLMKQAA